MGRIVSICPFCCDVLDCAPDSYEEKMRMLTGVSRCKDYGELWKNEGEGLPRMSLDERNKIVERKGEKDGAKETKEKKD